MDSFVYNQQTRALTYLECLSLGAVDEDFTELQDAMAKQAAELRELVDPLTELVELQELLLRHFDGMRDPAAARRVLDTYRAKANRVPLVVPDFLPIELELTPVVPQAPAPTPSFLCGRCDTPFEPASPRRARYCPPCEVKPIKVSKPTELVKIPKPPKTSTCKTCKIVFERSKEPGILNHWCAPCRAERERKIAELKAQEDARRKAEEDKPIVSVKPGMLPCATCKYAQVCPYGCTPGVPCDHAYLGYQCRANMRECAPTIHAHLYQEKTLGETC